MKITYALDDSEVQFLTDVGTLVCKDPTDPSTCKGLTLNNQKHIIGMCAPFLFQSFFFHHMLHCASHDFTLDSDWSSVGISSFPDSIGNLSYLTNLFASPTFPLTSRTHFFFVFKWIPLLYPKHQEG